MKRKVLSLVIALCIAATFTVPAFAATPQDAEAPQDGDTNASPGDARITAKFDDEDAVIDDWSVNHDDSDISGPTQKNSADIGVWARVIEDADDIVYCVDIEWGNMKFEFKRGTFWDPDVLNYVDSEDGMWTVGGYLDGVNNKVEVFNRSNSAIDAGFAYGFDGNPFGTGNTVDYGFYDNNTDALAAALLVSDDDLTLNFDSGNQTATFGLPAATPGASEPPSDDIFFAFSGAPAVGSSATLSDFTKVGLITVTITPTNTP